MPSNGDITADIPVENHQALAARIQGAAEMGDMTELQAIAEEVNKKFMAHQSLNGRIVELANNFDLDGLTTLAESLNSSA